MECIVLAGGLGTRLRGTIGDQPKCMAEVNGQPFLHYLLEYLEAQGCSRVILSLGYRHEVVTDWLRAANKRADFVIEQEPLGTGGGMQLALKAVKDKHVVVLNGDTFFRVDLADLLAVHEANGAEATLGLKEMHDFDRYGVVNVDTRGCITSFEEKKPRTHGLINGGAYVVDRIAFLNRRLPEKFSFEKDYLEAFVGERKFFGCSSSAYFIDIGVPEDYYRAGRDFALF